MSSPFGPEVIQPQSHPETTMFSSNTENSPPSSPATTSTETTTQSNDSTTTTETVYTCCGANCDKPAKMQCPTCVKFSGPPSHFCDQDCFKSNWAVHSRIHPELRAKFEFQPPKIKYTGSLRPAYVTPQQTVTDVNIKKPDYHKTTIPESERTSPARMTAPVYTKDEIAGIRAACQLSRAALDYACSLIKPGISTDEIDKATHNFIVSKGGYPSPLNYRGFPKSICRGDIINIDVSVFLNGFHGDLNETHTVGTCDYESKRLIKASYDAFNASLHLVKPGTLFRDFGEAVSHSIRKHGFSSGRSYCGHGIGHSLHCAPNIPHYARNKATGQCKPGMVFSIEPMINAGDWHDDHWMDEWTCVTADGKQCAI